MGRLTGLLLLLLGIAVMVTGIGLALKPLVDTYAANMQDPMGDKTTAIEDGLRPRMIRGVVIGAAGVVPLLIGSVVLKRSLFRRRR